MWVWFTDLTTDWREEKLRQLQTIWCWASRHCLAEAWGSLFRWIYHNHYWSQRMIFVAFKRHQEKITILGGNHCMEHRNEMLLHYHYNSVALGVIITNSLHSALNLCYPTYKSADNRSMGGASGSFLEMQSQASPQWIWVCIVTNSQVIWVHIKVWDALLGLFYIILYNLVFRSFSEGQDLVLI